LAGMRERAEASGGDLRIQSEIGNGTEITIRCTTDSQAGLSQRLIEE